jgi:hypothetical protein
VTAADGVTPKAVHDVQRNVMKQSALSGLAVLLVAAAFAATAHASCLRSTPAEQRARAQVIFDGVALDGPTPTGIQRFQVVRYLKGRGPQIVRVNTGNIRHADGSVSVTSVSILVERGQRWRIFAQGTPPKALRTNLCDGSRRL